MSPRTALRDRWSPPDLSKIVALVTGASRGVGRGIAEVLGECGATVYVTGRTRKGRPDPEGMPGTVAETAAIVTARGGKGVAVVCDHMDDRQVERLFARIRRGHGHGRLDLLVNNIWGGYQGYDAGTFSAPFWKQRVELWDRMFDTGPRVHFTASRLAAGLMLPRRRGLIVHISSGDLRGRYLGNVPYDTAKAAVNRLAFGMAEDLRRQGIAAVSLLPGWTRTERVLAFYKGDMGKDYALTHSPEFAGRVVACLAADRGILKKTGRTFPAAALAREYGFTDTDGRRIKVFRLPD